MIPDTFKKIANYVCIALVVYGIYFFFFKSIPVDDSLLRDSQSKIMSLEKIITDIDKKYPDVKHLNPVEVVEIQQSGKAMIFVDTRSEAEQEVSMLPGAITASDFVRDQEKFKEHLIVSYCTVGARSAKFTRGLVAKNLNAVNLRGSILAWAQAGYKVYDKEGKPTLFIHVYGPKWDLLPDEYKAVSSMNYWDKL